MKRIGSNPNNDMRYAIILLAFLILGCNQPKDKTLVKTPAQDVKKTVAKDSLQPAIIDTIVLKDINSDKIPDTAFVYTPPTLASFDEKGNIEFEMGCADNNCFNKITFSCALPEIVFKESVWGAVENAGDLDGDGIAELLFVPGWFTSSMTKLYLYTYKKGKWEINTTVEYRRGDEPFKPNPVVRKGSKYYLRGVDLSDGEDKPYEVPIKFRK
jgi:hypothetical protein